MELTKPENVRVEEVAVVEAVVLVSCAGAESGAGDGAGAAAGCAGGVVGATRGAS